MKWTDIWQKPFRYDGYGYIWCGDGIMTFSTDMERDPCSDFIKKLMNDMLTVLNGGELETKYEHLNIKDGCDLYYGDVIIGSFRGWGHLTGTAALHLPAEEAAKLQDGLIEFVLSKMQK